ncbi:HpcH/HpaI aldolase/citrate lyase family protein [Pontixanthobacter aquaemixtae]|uniref:CoA ester lyase n=1 Tax=Pontixanthobacter aquaemixtae TaxID=1958940 RepID=A0A844ZNP8_9SPHN|nr:CoA ester lyase [Pontixanthobacter aquaemixtae]MXO89378.1 CoA ester lyase [Pontixanthobacter aquaemixtae]
MRSWLFIEGDNAAKMGKAPGIGADALVLDLSHVVAGPAAAQLRMDAAEWLTMHGTRVTKKAGFSRWLRIKSLDQPHWHDDLAVALQGAPDGLILPKCTGPEQIRTLASELYELEQRLGIEHSSTKIIPQIGSTPGSALTLRDYTDDPHPRLAGFAWDAEGLARALGAQRTHTETGAWCDTMRLVRGTVILLAKTLGLMAIETQVSDPKDVDTGLLAARGAKQDGFTGMCASHPRQVRIINQQFAPTPSERAEAQRIVSLFKSNPSASAVDHNGALFDRKALGQAERLLAVG